MKHTLNSVLFILILALEFIFLRDSIHFLTYIIVTCVLFLLIVGAGVLFLRLNYFVKATYRIKGEKVLLTFDDGPEPEKTQKILEILKEHNIGAVFFLIGRKVEQNLSIAEEIESQGHVIGNHTYTHNNFAAFSSTKSLIREMEKTEKILDSISEDRPKLFRPPIGYTTPNYKRALKQLNLSCIGWRLRSYDTISKNPERFINRLVKTTRKGDIVLFHDNLDITLECLPKYISDSKRDGIIFVSKDEVKNIFS